MDKKLYELMNWPRIEALVYSEEDEPQEILGPHKVKGGTLIQAFLPTAVRMEVILKDTGKAVEMEKADDEGSFAALAPGRKIPSYHIRVTYDNDTVQALEDI